MATRSTEADLAAEVRGFTDLRRLIFSQEHAPARSVALITVEMSEAFPPAGSQALEVAPVVLVVFTAAVVDNGDWFLPPRGLLVETSMVKKNMTPKKFLYS